MAGSSDHAYRAHTMSELPQPADRKQAQVSGGEHYAGAWAAAATLVIAVALASGAVP